MNKINLNGKFAVVLPAGGLGKRMGGDIPKQLMLLNNKPIYRYSLETFVKMEEFAEVVIVVPAEWKDYFQKDIFENKTTDEISQLIHSKVRVVIGGPERWLSVKDGIMALTSEVEYALIHDVARPFISNEIIKNVCNTLIEKGSCLVAKPAVDTIKIARNDRIENTIDRNIVWMAQTPQAARINLLKVLYTKMSTEPLNFLPTDEASILEYFKEPVYIVKGNSKNDKITTPEDFEIFANYR